MRKTLTSQQEIIDRLTLDLIKSREELLMLREQNKFLVTQSTSGQLAAMNCTVQRLAECATELVKATNRYR